MPRTDAAPLTDVGLKALSPAELEYMNIIWQHPDGMSSEVLYGFFPNHALKTKRVILHNIIKKGYLKSERIGRHQKYFSVVSESDYNKALEKHSFIKKVLVNQCVDIDLKRHQLIATDILHAMPVTIVPDCT